MDPPSACFTASPKATASPQTPVPAPCCCLLPGASATQPIAITRSRAARFISRSPSRTHPAFLSHAPSFAPPARSLGTRPPRYSHRNNPFSGHRLPASPIRPSVHPSPSDGPLLGCLSRPARSPPSVRRPPPSVRRPPPSTSLPSSPTIPTLHLDSSSSCVTAPSRQFRHVACSVIKNTSD